MLDKIKKDKISEKIYRDFCDNVMQGRKKIQDGRSSFIDAIISRGVKNEKANG